MPVEELCTASSIQRCSPIGWSVVTRKPIFSVQNFSAASWSRQGMPANFRWVIMRGLPRGGPSIRTGPAETTIPTSTIVLIGMRTGLDRYVIDVLMRDLVGHDHTPSAFLVYLWLWART